MARLRSPGYPNAPLGEVIDLVSKIHEKDRQHPVTREVAAQHMGFRGLTGTSDRALSALMHYGLAEKAGKGEIRVSDLALQIIHPSNADEKMRALQEAAFSPDLFKELRGRYPGEPPSSSSLGSYLSRSNFAPAAIPSAVKAYLETCYYLQRERAYESDPQTAAGPSESPPIEQMEIRQMQPQPVYAAPMPTPPVAAIPQIEDLALNEPNLVIKSGTVRVEALLDYEGLAVLEEQIKALKMLMKPKAKPAAKASVTDEDEQALN